MVSARPHRLLALSVGTGALLCLVLLLPATARVAAPASAADRNCGDFATQAEAQQFFLAAGGPASDPNNLDADHDGVACESLPCPCSASGGGHSPPSGGSGGGSAGGGGGSCRRPAKAIRVSFSRARYPDIISHIKASWRLGYPRVLRIDRIGTDRRRDSLLAGIPTKPGYDRDEAPAAVLRNKVQADVRYVPSSENRSAGSSLGGQISGYCNGVKVRYRFTP